jgi:ABC-type thiamine transport system substrate-binding protein
MRFKAALTVTILAAAMAAGCRGGEEQRQTVIDEQIRKCVEVFGNHGGGAAVGIDAQRTCQCLVQKLAEGKSVEEIRATDRKNDHSQADLQAVGACVVREAQREGAIAK